MAVPVAAAHNDRSSTKIACSQQVKILVAFPSLSHMKLPLSVVLLGIWRVIVVNASDIYNVGLPSITFDLRSGGEGDLRDVM